MEKLAIARKNELKRLIKKYEGLAAGLPDGRVYIKKKEKGNALILRSGGKRKGAPLENRYFSLKNDYAPLIATKYYVDSLVPVLKKEADALEEFEREYEPYEKYRVLELIPDDVSGIVYEPLLSWREKSSKWEKAPFRGNPVEFDPESEYYTVKGERVRSRAEIIIGDMLNSLGIPYRYECSHRIGDRKYYPDFTIMNPRNGEKYYIEYFGMMGIESYRRKAFDKIREYNKSKDADRFIYFFEDEGHPLDTGEIKNVILRKLGWES